MGDIDSCSHLEFGEMATIIYILLNIMGDPNSATMTKPDGTIWKCIYGHAANIKTIKAMDITQFLRQESLQL